MTTHTFKLTILFKRPPNLEEFQRRWSEEFVPASEKMPGLRRVSVSYIQGGPAGPMPFHLLHEFHFDNQAALTAAMASPEGVAAGRCLISIAPDSADLLFAEHMEDVPHPTGAPA